MKTAAFLRALWAAAMLALPLGAGAAPAAAPPAGLSDADQQCLGCHGQKGLEKTFANGSTVALHLEGASFAKSVHAPVGCAACHSDVDPARHPGQGGKPFANGHAMAVALSQACRTCHEAIFDAYAGGVHGKAQGKQDVMSPVCSSCHGTHEIVRASVGAARESCQGCHADSAASHAKWLPNSKVHLEVVACAACHAPAAGKRIELRFYEVATKRELVADAGSFSQAAMTGNGNGNGDAKADAAKPIDETRLRELVATIERNAPGKVILAGRLEPSTGTDGHKLLGKDQALKDCAICHRKGAEAFQNVSLSLVGGDGQRVRFEAASDVLNSPRSIESVRGLYAMGGTRIQVLDILLALALAGGIAAPLGHMAMRKVLRRKEQSHE